MDISRMTVHLSKSVFYIRKLNSNYHWKHAPGAKRVDRSLMGRRKCKKRSNAAFEVVDIANYNLPLLNEPTPQRIQQMVGTQTSVRSKETE